MRQQIDAMESQLKIIIARNLRRIMAEKGLSQVKLSELSGIPQSTISDVIKQKFLVNVGKIQQLADALKVPKSEIDPSFCPNLNSELLKGVENKFSNNIMVYPSNAHFEIGLNLIENLYFEGKLLTNEDKRKILEMTRILIS